MGQTAWWSRLVMAAVLASAAPAALAQTVPADLALDPASPGVNRFDISVTATAYGIGRSDTDTGTVTGNLLANLTFAYDAWGHEEAVTGLELTGGRFYVSDLAFTLDYGFLLGKLQATGTGIAGTVDTPAPPGPVSDGTFPTDPHEVLLDQGTFHAHGTGVVGTLFEPMTIDLATEPVTGSTVGTGDLAVSVPVVVGDQATYNVTLTLPVALAERVVEQADVVADVEVAGTLQASGQATRTVPPCWIGAQDTHWEKPANWFLGVMPGAGRTAVLDGAATAQPALFQPEAVRGLDFRTAGWTLGAGSTLTVGPDGVASAGAGVNTIGPDVHMTADSLWTVGTGNVLVLTGALDGGGNALAKRGLGTLCLDDAQNLGVLDVGSGLCRLTPGGDRVLAVEALSIANPAGTLDLTNNNLAVDYPDGGPNPLAAITDWLKSGQNIEAGYWDGPGIHSSTAAGDPTGLTTLGVLDNAEFGWPDLEGTPVDESCVLVKYAYYGDADLDGSTTGDDYFLWLAGFDAAREALAHGGEPTLSGWLYGDFDYSGDVTGDDYFLWLVAFDAARSGATPLSGGAAAAIPEPVSLSLLALGAALVGWQRRRTVAAP